MCCVGCCLVLGGLGKIGMSFYAQAQMQAQAQQAGLQTPALLVSLCIWLSCLACPTS